MDSSIYKILNSLYQPVYLRDIDASTYKIFAKTIMSDRSDASLARVKQNMILHRDTLDVALKSPSNRIYNVILQSTPVKLMLDHLDNTKNMLFIVEVTEDYNGSLSFLEDFIFNSSFTNSYFYFVSSNSSGEIADELHNMISKYQGKCGGIFLPASWNSKNVCIQKARMLFNNVDFDCLIDIDPCVINDTIDVDGFLSCFALNEPWDIICANNVFNKSTINADAVNLRNLGDDLDINKLYPYFEHFNDKSMFWIDKLYNIKSWHKVASAHGGIMIINKKVFKLTNPWDINVANCAVSLCSKFLNVYVNPDFMITSKLSAEGVLYPNPLMYVPNDTDFFGALNHMLAIFTQGCRVYPFLNIDTFEEKHKQKPGHFIHLDKSVENSWFEFFEPISFFKNDDTHINTKSLTLFTHTHGIDPSNCDIIQLHNIYKVYIKTNNTINERITKCWNCDSDIGVYFPQPQNAFSKTSFFDKYFVAINELLSENSLARIFLYTDYDIALLVFKNKYGDSLLYDSDFSRIGHDSILQGCLNNTINTTLSENIFDHGIDEISNAICLSKCQWLICSSECNLTKTVQIMNPNVKIIIT